MRSKSACLAITLLAISFFNSARATDPNSEDGEEIDIVEKQSDGTINKNSEKWINSIRARYGAEPTISMLIGLKPGTADAPATPSSLEDEHPDDTKLQRSIRTISEEFRSRYESHLHGSTYEDYFSYDFIPFVRVRADSTMFESMLKDREISSIS